MGRTRAIRLMRFPVSRRVQVLIRGIKKRPAETGLGVVLLSDPYLGNRTLIEHYQAVHPRVI
jgi:hypothetical protein